MAEMGEGPLEVHLVNNGPQLLEILGPVSIVVAALGGAWFAARYARDNTRQELAAAELRLDRQATRTTIDEVVVTMTEALDSAADLAVAIEEGETLQKAISEAAEGPAREAAEEEYENFAEGELEAFAVKAFEAHVRIPPARLRLRLRFAPGDPVLETFGKWNSVMSLAREQIQRGEGRVRTESELQKSKKIEAQIPISLEEFVSAVRSWIDRYEAK